MSQDTVGSRPPPALKSCPRPCAECPWRGPRGCPSEVQSCEGVCRGATGGVSLERGSRAWLMPMTCCCAQSIQGPLLFTGLCRTALLPWNTPITPTGRPLRPLSSPHHPHRPATSHPLSSAPCSQCSPESGSPSCTASVLPSQGRSWGLSHVCRDEPLDRRVHLPRWPPGPYSSGVFYSSQDPVSSFEGLLRHSPEPSRCLWPALSEPWPWSGSPSESINPVGLGLGRGMWRPGARSLKEPAHPLRVLSMNLARWVPCLAGLAWPRPWMLKLAASASSSRCQSRGPWESYLSSLNRGFPVASILANEDFVR